MRVSTYSIAPRGLATSFAIPEVPVDYALSFRNRFINAAGGAEKRQGIVQFGNSITGSPNLTGIHQYICNCATSTIIVSGEGKLWVHTSASTTQVYSGLDSDSRLQSVQMDDKLIFVNGVDRPIYTDDKGSTFQELRAIIEKGDTDTGTDETHLVDSDIENWTTDTNVVVNDIVNNLTVGGYGIITVTGSATATHTAIGTAATGIGVSTDTPSASDRYEILDLVELNIIPTDGDDDNTITAGAGTSSTVIAVSAQDAALDFSATDIRVGDFVRNTTRSAVTQVVSVSANINVTEVASQTAGDSLVFLKSAMPIASFAHVHYGRLYLVDARDQSKVRISGPGDPTNMTTDAGTLDSASISIGDQQPTGDFIRSISSFQRFLALHGANNLLLFAGTDPIASTAASTIDFDIIGMFPQNTVSKLGVQSIGNDSLFVTHDGVQAISLVDDSSTLDRANLTDALKTTIRDEIDTVSEDEIQLIHYPQRSWILFKLGTQIYVYNYTTYFGKNVSTRRGFVQEEGGSWSVFDGKFARQNAFFFDGIVDALYCAGPGGKVYRFDQDTYDDDGEVFSTKYQTGYLTMDEPKRTINIKSGNYIKPIIEAGENTTYTITAEGGFGADSIETITVEVSGGQSAPIGRAEIGTNVIGGSGVENEKEALRWRGEVGRFTFETTDNKGPDTLSRFSIYHNVHGQR